MTDIRALKDQATQYLAKGKLPAALEAWQKVAALTPNDPSSQQKVAEVFVKLGRKPDAVKAYEAAARGFCTQGQFFKASAVARLISSLDPTNTNTQELIARLFARDKDKATAVQAKAVVKPAAAPAPAAAPVEIAIEVEAGSDASGAPPPGELPTIPLFGTLTADELKEVLSSAMEVRVCSAGEVIVAEGAPGDSMFAMSEGSASVFRGWGTPTQRRVAAVPTGDVFGEAAMVSGAPRLASVVTDTEAVVLEFKREAMSQVISRFARVGEMLDVFYRERLLANVLRASPILRSLPDGEKQALQAAFQPATFVDAQRIINEGQPADSVYLLLRGTCVVTHASGGRYPDLREGDLFGEVSVLSGSHATASVAAQGPVLTLRLPAAQFKARVMSDATAAKAIDELVKVRLGRTAKLDEESFSVDVEMDDLRV